MSHHLDHLDHLRDGSPRQQAAYATLRAHRVLESLQAYDPILVGTIPIGIDLPGSDLDIICHCADLEAFSQALHTHFAHAPGWQVRTVDVRGVWAVVANFHLDGFAVEVFGQDIPTRTQLGYRHMVVEHALLQRLGAAFRDQVLAYRREGLKTEPAFARALGLEGDPYLALLQFEERH